MTEITLIRNYLQEVQQSLEEVGLQDLTPIVDLLHRAYLEKANVYLMGNGGSASTSSHFAAHLQEGIGGQGRGGLRAICLNDNVPRMTAVANDFDYESVFVIQIRESLSASDVVIIISGSGESPNVIKTAEMAKEVGSGIVAFTGFGGGKLHGLADCGVTLSSRQYGPIEDVHLTLGHLIPRLLQARIQETDMNLFV